MILGKVRALLSDCKFAIDGYDAHRRLVCSSYQQRNDGMLRIAPSKVLFSFAIGAALLPAWASAATPSVEQALKLKPAQPDVEYDRPTAEQAAGCKIVAKTTNGHIGWIVEGPDGVVLRKFVDTDGDNRVDQWSYYKDGLEVYRDIDTKQTGKPNEFRWFHTGGSRWGIDANGDGVIDVWRSISAEEVTSEVVAALAKRDARRFARLLLTADELRSLGLGPARTEGIAAKINKALAEFAAAAARQKVIGPDAVWVQFSAGRPGVVPAGTDQSTQDVRVYENVAAMVASGGRHAQVQIGTLVRVGDVWRAIDLPQPVAEGQTADAAAGGFFFQASSQPHGETVPTGAADATQKLLADLVQLDEAFKPGSDGASPAEHARYTSRRADLLDQIAAAAKTPDERASWLRQSADMLSAAVQSGVYPDGLGRLKSLFEKLDKGGDDKALAGYVRFRQLMAEYIVQLQAPKADIAKVQAEWQKTLEHYVADFPRTPDAAEAMLQLASSQEFAGQEDEAKKWYGRIVREFADSPAATKAAGAQLRLDSVGKTLAVSGRSPQGRTIDSAQYRGKVVLIQYWVSRSGSAKADMAALRELWNKYGEQFTIIGVSLDSDVKDLNAYLAENPLPWPQIYESGGMDSRPANALGILAVPTMILVDQRGTVVHRNVSVADLEGQLKKLIR
jgi:hypothetical protein